MAGISSLGSINNISITTPITTANPLKTISETPSTVISLNGSTSPKTGVELYKQIQSLESNSNINLISIETGLNPKIVIDFINSQLLKGRNPVDLTDQLIIALLLELIKNKQIDPILGI